MNRYPLWKGLLFAAVMVLALLLALPNLFGEAPALQLSRKDGELFVGAASLQPFQDLLDREKIVPDATYLQAGRAVLRLTMPERRDTVARRYSDELRPPAASAPPPPA
jgi:preprotein translocase subunit SecD